MHRLTDTYSVIHHLLDLDLLARSEPLVALAACELVHAVVAHHERRGAGPVKHHDRGDLVAAGGAEHARCLVPDAWK